MPYRLVPFINEEFYHIYNRGLEKNNIFINGRDYSRFLKALFYYQIQNPKPKFSLFQQSKIFEIDNTKKIVDIVCYCLMPNHFHLLIKQTVDGGISEFMRKFILSYTKYRNTKYERRGPIFETMFKALRVETDEQLLHLSRYIHLNPFVSLLVKDLKNYLWSSYPEYISGNNSHTIAKEEILGFFKDPTDYQRFVLDHADYATTLHILKHATLDEH